MLLVALVLFADATPANEIAEAAYQLSIEAREGRAGDDQFPFACFQSRECRGDCGDTLKWLVKRRDIDLGSLLDGKRSAPERPARLCSEAEKAGGSPEKLEAWARARFLGTAAAARRSATGRDADRLDCALGRIEKSGHGDACLRVEPAEAARMAHRTLGIDEPMIPLLMLKGCEELDLCSGACRGELSELASLDPHLPTPSKCELPPPRKNEKAGAWRGRVLEVAWKRLANYYRDQVLPKLGAWELPQVECDLSKLKLGPVIPGC